MWHVRGRGEVRTGLWWIKMKERGHLKDLGVEGRIIFKWIFQKLNVRAWSRLVWLST
jgi:hypothetical protein